MARQQAARLLSPVQSVVPDWAKKWLGAAQDHPRLFLMLAGGALLFSWLGGVLQRRAHDHSHRLWQARIAGTGFDHFPPPGLLMRARTGAVYQKSLQFLKWRIGPAAAALVLVVAAIDVGLGLITQVGWTFYESRACDAAKPIRVDQSADLFDTRSTCTALRDPVRRGHRYEIAIAIKDGDEWADGGLAADPTGVLPNQSIGENPRGWARQWLLALNRRIVDAKPMQPIYEVRPGEDKTGDLLHPAVRKLTLETDPALSKNGVKVWTGIFLAADSGDLFLFVNDTPMLGNLSGAYRDNRGRAAVTVRDLDAAQDSVGAP